MAIGTCDGCKHNGHVKKFWQSNLCDICAHLPTSMLSSLEARIVSHTARAVIRLMKKTPKRRKK